MCGVGGRGGGTKRRYDTIRNKKRVALMSTATKVVVTNGGISLMEYQRIADSNYHGIPAICRILIRGERQGEGGDGRGEEAARMRR